MHTMRSRGVRFTANGARVPRQSPFHAELGADASYWLCLDRFDIAEPAGFDAFYQCAADYWLNQAIGFVR